MLRKTMSVLAKASALTSGLTVATSTHGSGSGQALSAADSRALGCLHRHRKPPLCFMGGCSR
jgi:hypothetical protein